MNEQYRNPFRPAFGIAPRVWAGRTVILDTYAAALHSFPGDQARTLVISGLRGIGKTALVNELEDLAKQQGWLILRVHATDKEPITTLVETTIPTLLEQHSPPTKRTITGATIAGIGAIQTTINEPNRPVPTLNSQLRALTGLLKPHGTGIVISIDEVQHANPDDLAVIATAYQDLIRDGIDISFIVAGLSRGVDALLQHPGTTFIRRGLRVELTPLTPDEAQKTLIETAKDSVVSMDEKAAASAAQFAQGHPYLLQLIGSLSWAHARSHNIDIILPEHVDQVKATAISSLGMQVHQPELKYLTQAETKFVEAMAKAMTDTHQAAISEVAKILGKPVTSLSDVRAKLLLKEVISVPAHGKLSFRLPYFKEYLLLPDSFYPFKQLSY